MLCNSFHAAVEQRDVTAEFVDDEGFDPITVSDWQDCVRSNEVRDDTTAFDVTRENDRKIGCFSEAHVGDIPRAEIDFSRAAGTFDDNEICC